MGPPLHGERPCMSGASRRPRPTGQPCRVGAHIMRPSVRSFQMRRNFRFCGTFRYIYWELGRSAPGGGRAAARAAPTAKFRLKTADAQCAPLHRIYERLYIQEKGQVWNLSLKTQRRNAVSHKISLVPFFFKERNCSIPSRCPSSGPPGGRGGRPQTGCLEIRLQCARPCWDR